MTNSRYLLLLFCYTLTGVTSLAYEVLWARMLSLQFGVSIFGVVVTVAAFMLGLGGGSLFGSSLAARSRVPLRLFALMELLVAVYALLLPLIFRFADQWLTQLSADLSVSGWFMLQGSALLLLMLLPALAMGVAFPLILRSLERFNGSLPLLYGLNACGGALGALLPLLLLPAFGWTVSVRAMAVAGCTIAITVFWLSCYRWPAFEPGPPAASENGSRPSVKDLFCYAGVGAAALILEIGWTRLYGMVMLRTEYVLAVILAVFLLGIGVGSLAGRWLHRHFWLLLMPAVAAGYASLSLWLLPTVSAWVERSEWNTLAQALVLQGGILALLTLPVTLTLGAWLPVLARRICAAGEPGHGEAGARLYGANSIGAASGALLSGFVLIPWLGTTETMLVAMLLLLLCGLYFAPRSRIAWVMPPLLLAIAWPVHDFPSVASLLPRTQGGSRDLYRYEDAVSITHVVERADGQRLLLSDLQRMDASTDPAAVSLQKDQARLPLLLHGSPRSILFLGLGTGITASGSLPLSGLQRTAVELSPGAIHAAAQQFAMINDDVVAAMRVVNHDGRYFLRRCRQHYDVIVGDVFHPDMAGRSALLSVEQFERARECLNDNGWFVQWLALNQFDVDALQIVIRSFARVFPDMLVFVDGFRLALVGPNGPADAAIGHAARRMGDLLDAMKVDDAMALTGGEGRWTWLGRVWGRPDPGPGPLQHEWSPQIEFSLPAARYRGDIDVASVMDWLLQRRPPARRAAEQLGVAATDFGDFERAYTATTLAFGSWQDRLRQRQGDADRLIRFANQANPLDRWAGISLADDMLATLPQALKRGMDKRQALEAILAIRPDHVDTLYELWQMARARRDSARARIYLQRLRRLSPLDRRFRAAPDG
jgi:spermidine synthase